jgi:hypothetical protein
MNTLWEQITRGLPAWGVKLLAGALSLASGAITAVILHYMLYRLGLPSTPFIYVAF